VQTDVVMSAQATKSNSLNVPNDDTLVVIKSLPNTCQPALLKVRDAIFEVGEDERIGGVQETLKWNQPAYVPRLKKTGLTLRLGYDEERERGILYGHCQTTIIDQWRERYNDEFEFLGNRALTFSIHGDIPATELAECVWLGLTYHQRK